MGSGVTQHKIKSPHDFHPFCGAEAVNGERLQILACPKKVSLWVPATGTSAPVALPTPLHQALEAPSLNLQIAAQACFAFIDLQGCKKL